MKARPEVISENIFCGFGRLGSRSRDGFHHGRQMCRVLPLQDMFFLVSPCVIYGGKDA